MPEVGGTRLIRLFLHISARWHLALAKRANRKALLHARKCRDANERLLVLVLEAGDE